MGEFKIKDVKNVLFKSNGEMIEIDYLNDFVKTENKDEIKEKEWSWEDILKKYNLNNLKYDPLRKPIQTADTEIVYDGTLYFLDMATLEVLKKLSEIYYDKKVIITEIKNEDEYDVETDKPFTMMKTKIIVNYDIE